MKTKIFKGQCSHFRDIFPLMLTNWSLAIDKFDNEWQFQKTQDILNLKNDTFFLIVTKKIHHWHFLVENCQIKVETLYPWLLCNWYISLFSLEWFISLLISCYYPRCNIWQLNFQVKDFMEKSIRRLRLHLLEILKDNSWSRLLEFKKSDWMRLKCCSRCILIISLAKKAPHKNH